MVNKQALSCVHGQQPLIWLRSEAVSLKPKQHIVCQASAKCILHLQVRAQIRKIFTNMGFQEMPTNNYVESR